MEGRRRPAVVASQVQIGAHLTGKAAQEVAGGAAQKADDVEANWTVELKERKCLMTVAKVSKKNPGIVWQYQLCQVRVLWEQKSLMRTWQAWRIVESRLKVWRRIEQGASKTRRSKENRGVYPLRG